jgi:L-aminopeptidase/D-esterase-like protein
MVRAISPVNTMSDGDMVFGCSVGEASASIDTLGASAAEALSQAILRAVRLAKPLNSVPAYSGL